MNPEWAAKYRASVRLRALMARKVADRCDLTVPSEMFSSRAISLLGVPLRARRSTSSWRCVRFSSEPVCAPSASAGT